MESTLPSAVRLSLSQAAEHASRLSASRLDVALLVACAAAVLAIRVQLLLSTEFPLNDGGLFLAFVQAIAREFPGIPSHVAYNGLDIPFAYPPLSFWLAALGVRGGLDALTLVHLLPILMNVAYVLLFALLLLRTGHSPLFTAIALLVFGTTFRSYEWLVMGGGLSRGLGSLFLLLTLLTVMRDWRQPGAARWSVPRLLVAGVCVGGAVASHLEWGILAALSSLLCLALARPGWAGFVRASFIVGITSLIVVAPWLLRVYTVHGFEPFAAAAGTGQWSSYVFLGSVKAIARTSNFILPFVVVGIVSAFRGRDLFWLLFMGVALLLTPRTGETPMVLSLGVLAAGGFLTCLVMLRQWAGGNARKVLAGFVLFGVMLTALRTTDATRRDENFVALAPELRSAMSWVATRHAGERFAVLKEAPWHYNASAEWFPVLAGAVNVTTSQGREWFRGEFERATLATDTLNASTTCAQVLSGLRAFGPAQFVWVEGIDLHARAAAIKSGRARRGFAEWMAALGRAVRGAPGFDRGRGLSALRGEGTAAGCFDELGYAEVYANERVRIFRVPSS